MKNIAIKLINNIFSKKNTNFNEKNKATIQENLARFTYIACALNRSDIEITESHDNIGGYYKNKILLPKEISISENKETNELIYIYKIIFMCISKKYKFYLPENINKTNYIFLASILTTKTIHKNMYLEYPNTKKTLISIYKIINSKRKSITELKDAALIFEIILKKITYQPIKENIKLSKKENQIIYEIENSKIVKQSQLKKKINIIYKKISQYEKKDDIELNPIWNYLYYKEVKKKINSKNHKLTKNKKEHEYKKNINIKIENTKKEEEEDSIKNSLKSLFEYNKTTDDYKKNNKEITGSNEKTTTPNTLEDINIEHCTRSKHKTKSILKSNVVNNIYTKNIKSKNITKKYIYNEWNYKKNQYNNNWCNVFQIEQNDNNIQQKEIEHIHKIIKDKDKEIKAFKEKLKKIINIKTWKPRQKSGQEIDYDSIIDEYKDIKYNLHEKIYKYKKKTISNIAIIILIDSSISTDSYSKNKKIIEIIKEILILISYGINKITKNFLIASFYSNTRHDCRFNIIKNVNEKLENKIKNIAKINPTGYTRIGPAIRHSINILKKLKEKNKIILLISDGKPTDYDEYEGMYGISDIRKAIYEANKENISIKSIIADHIPKAYLPIMLGLNNYTTTTDYNTITNRILKLIHKSIN